MDLPDEETFLTSFFSSSKTHSTLACCALAALAASLLSSCNTAAKVQASNRAADAEASVGVVKIGRKPLARTLTLSSELVRSRSRKAGDAGPYAAAVMS